MFCFMGRNGVYTKRMGLRGQVSIGKVVENSRKKHSRRKSGVFLCYKIGSKNTAGIQHGNRGPGRVHCGYLSRWLGPQGNNQEREG